MGRVRIIFCMLVSLTISGNTLASAVCAENGEPVIDTEKYLFRDSDRYDQYKWVEPFLVSLNSFYDYLIIDGRNNSPRVIESLYNQAVELAKEVDIPEVRCVIESYDTGRLQQLADNHIESLQAERDRANAEKRAENEQLLSFVRSSVQQIQQCKQKLKHRNSVDDANACLNDTSARLSAVLDSSHGLNDDEARVLNAEIAEFNEALRLAAKELPTLAEQLPPKPISRTCIYNVCTGDPINSHIGNISDVDSEKLNQYRQAVEENLRMQSRLTGDEPQRNPELGAYLAMGSFDKNTMRHLDNIEVFCEERKSLSGTLISENGTLRIRIGQMISDDNPYWGITEIIRFYELTPAQIKPFIKKLEESYPGISSGTEAAKDSSTVSYFDWGLSFQLRLALSQEDLRNYGDVRQFNVCTNITIPQI